MVISKKTIIFKGFSQRGSNNFQGGVQFFPGGVQMLISIETHITCDFPGGEGGPDPLSPPLDLHMVLTGNMFSNFRTF